ncbi:MAG: hypothetical protein M3400_05125 [Actinomycetota bacterium]|nr:hypothetical protein [Actinomycetota bacterium]
MSETADDTSLRRGQHAAAARLTPPARRAAGLVLASLAIVAVVVRQLTSNLTVPAPASVSEAALGVNAFAVLHAPELRIPTSFSDIVTSWQLAGYSNLTSATARHDTLVGPTRELVLIASVLTAAVIVGACRRLHIGWFSTALAVILAGLPAAAVLLRIVSPSAALATFWMASATLAGLAAASGTRWRWPWWAVAVAAGALGISTAGVSVLIPLGLLLGALATGRRLYGGQGPRSRLLTAAGLAGGVAAALWLTVWQQGLPSDDLTPVGVAGIAVGLGGLVIAAACSVAARLRPMAFGVVPLLLAAVWPGAAQVPAMLLGLTIVAILTGCLLDNLLRHRRPPADAVVGTVTLVAAVAVGMFLLPLPEPSSPMVSPSEDVTAWLTTQLAPDSVIEVDPLSRAQLVRDGLEPGRLRTPNGPDTDAEFVLAPLSERAGLPLIARFGSDAGALGLRLVVADPLAYAEAMVTDQAARGRYGAELAANPNLILGPPASAALIAGGVDARLMVGLSAAAATARFAIEQFTGTAGDLDIGTIFREATLSDISALDPSIASRAAASRALTELFKTQVSPYRPLVVLESGTTVTVRYPAPAPFGLLP